MIKVGITGQTGFIGSHLYNWLTTKPDQFELIEFEKGFFDNIPLLEEFCDKCQVIVHLAAMNRAPDPQVIYDNNVVLVERLILACKKSKTSPSILFSSSTQELADNLYGKSKLVGKRLFENFATNSGISFTSITIPNVFGPFCRPNYNSFVATFCDKFIRGEEPKIIMDAEVGLIYVQELVEILAVEIVSCAETSIPRTKSLNINSTVKIKVSEVFSKLKKYKEWYIERSQIPSLPSFFDVQLFNTFRSHISPENFKRSLVPHADNRGVFVEIIRTDIGGQSSFSITVPDITRGNHFHTRKIERFAVLKGKALIKLRKVNTNEIFEYYLDGNTPEFVDMPVWFTHNIKNIGKEELITFFWINEAYDPADPDTYFETV